MADAIAPLEMWIFRFVVIAAVGGFAAQMATRFRLLQAAPGGFSLDHLGFRLDRFVSEVVFQTRTIRGRTVAGIAHLLVFWGFCAFGGFTAMEALRGLGVIDITATGPAR